MSNEELELVLKDYKIKERCNQVLLGLIPDLIFLMDRDGNYIRFQIGKGFLFIPEEMIEGSNIKESGMPQEVIEQILWHNNEAFDTGNLIEINYSLPTPTGGKHFFESRAMKFDERRVLRLVRDVTDRTLAETRISEFQHLLIQINEIAASELRNPIANMLSVINNNESSTMDEAEAVLQKLKNSLGILELKVSKINQLLKSKTKLV